MQLFLENNWLSIVSILIGILVAYVFYRLQKKDSASASAERKKRATAELLDVVESYIINKQRLSEHVINNLIHASERDHQVALRPDCTSVSLLQDVALRLQRSRHLDIPQKSEYSEKIEQLIQEISSDRKQGHIDYTSEELTLASQQLRDLVPPEKLEVANQLLSTIAASVKKQREASLQVEETKERFMVLTTTLLGVMASLSTALIGNKFFDQFTSNTLSGALTKVFPLFGGLLAAVVLLAALTTVLRIRRRGQQSSRTSDKPDA